MVIRSLLFGDEDALAALCLACSPLRTRTLVERTVITQAYAKYYLDCELATCLVLEDDGVLQGALLCAPEYRDYARRFTQRYFPKLAQYG